MTREEFEDKIRSEYGYRGELGYKLKNNNSVIEFYRDFDDEEYVQLDTHKEFSNRQKYPIKVRMPRNPIEFTWVIKMSRYLGTEEGYQKLARHNRIVIDHYPEGLANINFDRITIL